MHSIISIRCLIIVPVFPSCLLAPRVTFGMTLTLRGSSRSRTRHPSATIRAPPWPVTSRHFATWSAQPSTRMASRTCSQKPSGSSSTHNQQPQRGPVSCCNGGSTNTFLGGPCLVRCQSGSEKLRRCLHIQLRILSSGENVNCFQF